MVELICCPDLATYKQVASSLTPRMAPVLSSGRFSPIGFPSGTRVVLAEALNPQVLTRSAGLSLDPRRLCLSASDPICSALSECLARATGRTLKIVPPDRWAETLEQSVHAGLQSLTLVVPMWGKDNGYDPWWIGESLRVMRSLSTEIRSLSWGLLTSIEPFSMSLLVAKSLLQESIIQAFSDTPGCVFTTGTREAEQSALPPMQPECKAPLQHVDASHIADRSALQILPKRWSMMLFFGHGRAYCGCQGYLCGARHLSDDPGFRCEKCVHGLDCASPVDGAWGEGMLAFPRIDPRRYETPFMVIDACGSGTWAVPGWTDGSYGRDSALRGMAFHALAGAPGAVLTSDSITVHRPGSFKDVLWALSSGATAGNAAALLNGARPQAAGPFPYFLLGDPELMAGHARWPNWSSPATVDARKPTEAGGERLLLSVSANAPFASLTLPVDRGGDERPSLWTTGIETCEAESTASVVLEYPRTFVALDRNDLWFTARPLVPGNPELCIVVDRRPAIQMPPSVLAAAVKICEWRKAWTPLLQDVTGALDEAALEVLAVSAMLRRCEGTALIGSLDSLEVAVERCFGKWLRAHLSCIEGCLSLAEGGLWPHRLWNAERFRNALANVSCPHCGLSPVLERIYESFPGGQREQHECQQCVLVLDKPRSSELQLGLRAPGEIRVGQCVTVEITLDNTQSDVTFLGFGAVLVDGRAHGVLADPPFPITLEPRGRLETQAALSLPDPPPISHRYFVRLLVFINGQWSTASAPIRVMR